MDSDEAKGRVLADMRATHHRRNGRIHTTMRMMGVFRHRAHLVGLVGLTDNPTDGGRDRRAGDDGREDPRRQASNHQIASIANYSRDGPEQCVRNAIPSGRLELHTSQAKGVEPIADSAIRQ